MRARKDSDGKALVDLAKDAGFESKVVPIILDVTSADDIAAAIRSVKFSGQPLVGVIAERWVHIKICYRDCATDHLRHVFNVNVFGALDLIQAAIPELRKTKGRVITIGGSPIEVDVVSSRLRWSESRRASATKHSMEVRQARLV